MELRYVQSEREHYEVFKLWKRNEKRLFIQQ